MRLCAKTSIWKDIKSDSQLSFINAIPNKPSLVIYFKYTTVTS